MEININDIRLGVIGCGKMASAILSSIHKNNFLDKKNIYLFDINIENAKNSALKFGFNFCESLKDLFLNTNTVLIAIKPFGIDELLKNIKPLYNNHLILSILAGVKLEKYESYINSKRIVRIMPNTPALCQEAMSAVCSNKADSYDIEFAYNLMANCGKVIKTNEDKIDVITALSGSGPAFYYRIIDLMAKSAQKSGLDYKDAILLSAQTALGSAKMLIENDFDVELLIKNVTTPGGCTEVGNNAIMQSDLDKILDKTIEDTKNKAIALG